jgi:hypothetical protein
MRLEYRENLPEMICDPQQLWYQEMLLPSIYAAVRQLPAGDQRLPPGYLNAEHGSLKGVRQGPHLPGSTMRYRLSRIFRELRTIIGEDQ